MLLYLASSSPRRQALLAQIGVSFERLPVDIDETPRPAEVAADYVQRLALEKALTALARLPAELRGQALVLGADTSVVLDGRILGKPQDRSDALAMLAALSGRSHQVLTALALVGEGCRHQRLVTSRVSLRPLQAGEAERYWDSGEPRDKAGSYAIQGLGGVFVSHLEGSYSAVVGLPLCETAELLAACAIPVWHGA